MWCSRRSSPESRHTKILPLQAPTQDASSALLTERTDRRRQGNWCSGLSTAIAGCCGRVVDVMPERVTATCSWLATPFKPSTYQQSERDQKLFNPKKPGFLSEVPSYDNRNRLLLQQLLNIAIEAALFLGVEMLAVWLADCKGAIGDDALHCGGNIGNIKALGYTLLGVFSLLNIWARYKRMGRVRGFQEEIILLEQICRGAEPFVQQVAHRDKYTHAEQLALGVAFQGARLFNGATGLKQILSQLRTDPSEWPGHHQSCPRNLQKIARLALVVPGSISVSVWGTIMLVTVDENPNTGWEGKAPIEHMSPLKYVLITMGTAGALYLKWGDDLTRASTELKGMRSALLAKIATQKEALVVFDDAGAAHHAGVGFEVT